MRLHKDALRKEIEVSIVMPAFNSEQYIEEAMESVLCQTYANWELLVVDDCSSDRTPEIIKYHAARDGRIKPVRLDTHSGASKARNTAMTLASGIYIAFLDSDDLWHPEKLALQTDFMEKNNLLFSCTSYRKIDERGEDMGQIVAANETQDYEGLLRRCPGNSTVMYNARVLGKFTVPHIRKRNDYALWLQVIKKAENLYGLDEILCCYRVRLNSLSARKIPLVKYQWQVYRSIEKLPLGKSFRLLFYVISRRLYHTCRIFFQRLRPATEPDGSKIH